LSKAKASDEYIFTGCPGEEAHAEEIYQTLNKAEKIWNKHQTNELLNLYTSNFRSDDGSDIEDIRKRLGQFWFNYPDSRIESHINAIYVCGDTASVSLAEMAVGSQAHEKGAAADMKPVKYRTWFTGTTVLKKKGNTWKISQENIQTEHVWNSYGSLAEDLISKGKIKLIAPERIETGSNYIAKLLYDLPASVQGRAIIYKNLLQHFPEDEDGGDDDQVSSPGKALFGANTQEGTRRLFRANNTGQDEMVSAQIELISLTKGKPAALAGRIIISQRVIIIPKPSPAKEKKTATKSFREEALGKKDKK